MIKKVFPPARLKGEPVIFGSRMPPPVMEKTQMLAVDPEVDT